VKIRELDYEAENSLDGILDLLCNLLLVDFFPQWCASGQVFLLADQGAGLLQGHRGAASSQPCPAACASGEGVLPSS